MGDRGGFRLFGAERPRIAPPAILGRSAPNSLKPPRSPISDKARRQKFPPSSQCRSCCRSAPSGQSASSDSDSLPHFPAPASRRPPVSPQNRGSLHSSNRPPPVCAVPSASLRRDAPSSSHPTNLHRQDSATREFLRRSRPLPPPQGPAIRRCRSPPRQFPSLASTQNPAGPLARAVCLPHFSTAKFPARPYA